MPQKEYFHTHSTTVKRGGKVFAYGNKDKSIYCFDLEEKEWRIEIFDPDEPVQEPEEDDFQPLQPELDEINEEERY